MINILSQTVGDKYRILSEGEHLPEEIYKHELDALLNELKSAASHLSTVLNDIYHKDNNISYKLTKCLMQNCGLSYDDGKEWRINYLISEIKELINYLHASPDEVASYEDSETIFDDGYSEEWHNSNIYVKTLEDSDEKEVVREIIIKDDIPIYRERITLWEIIPGGKHSKNISYRELKIDNRLKKLIYNTFKKQIS